MKLNTLQQKAFDAIIVDKESIVVLTGEGGTGKTHTTSEIIKAYKSGTIAVTATTNKSKEVLAQMSGMEARTIQSQMGFVIVQADYRQTLQRERTATYADLLIIEEISMLPLSVYKFLMDAQRNGYIQQLLFLGDPIQLKAIGESIEPSKIPGLHIELTQQMRQKNADEPLKQYLADLRHAIDTEGQPPAFPDNSPSIQLIHSHKEFAELYHAEEGVKKIIAYRNKVVDKYNNNIHSGEEHFLAGDLVVIDKPIGKARNGDLVYIQSVVLDDEFNRYKLRIRTSNGDPHTIYHWNSSTEYNDLLNTFVDKEDEQGYWNIRNYAFNLKHQYACSIHKAQGSSYDAVFLDGTDLWNAHSTPKNEWNHPISMDEFLRMLYVSVSRMRTKCYIFVGELRTYQKFSV